MTKLEKLIYDAIQSTIIEHGYSFDYFTGSEAIATAVIPLIEKAAIDAGTEHGGWDGFEDWWNEWLSENVNFEATDFDKLFKESSLFKGKADKKETE